MPPSKSNPSYVSSFVIAGQRSAEKRTATALKRIRDERRRALEAEKDANKRSGVADVRGYGSDSEKRHRVPKLRVPDRPAWNDDFAKAAARPALRAPHPIREQMPSSPIRQRHGEQPPHDDDFYHDCTRRGGSSQGNQPLSHRSHALPTVPLPSSRYRSEALAQDALRLSSAAAAARRADAHEQQQQQQRHAPRSSRSIGVQASSGSGGGGPSAAAAPGWGGISGTEFAELRPRPEKRPLRCSRGTAPFDLRVVEEVLAMDRLDRAAEMLTTRPAATGGESAHSAAPAPAPPRRLWQVPLTSAAHPTTMTQAAAAAAAAAANAARSTEQAQAMQMRMMAEMTQLMHAVTGVVTASAAVRNGESGEWLVARERRAHQRGSGSHLAEEEEQEEYLAARPLWSSSHWQDDLRGFGGAAAAADRDRQRQRSGGGGNERREVGKDAEAAAAAAAAAAGTELGASSSKEEVLRRILRALDAAEEAERSARRRLESPSVAGPSALPTALDESRAGAEEIGEGRQRRSASAEEIAAAAVAPSNDSAKLLAAHASEILANEERKGGTAAAATAAAAVAGLGDGSEISLTPSPPPSPSAPFVDCTRRSDVVNSSSQAPLPPQLATPRLILEVQPEAAQSILRHRAAFERHRRVQEAPLRETGLRQSDVAELIADEIAEDVVAACAAEVEQLLAGYAQKVLRDV